MALSDAELQALVMRANRLVRGADGGPAPSSEGPVIAVVLQVLIAQHA